MSVTTIITTTQEIQQYVAVNMATNIETLQPYIRQASRLHLRPLLGTETYTALLAAYEGASHNVESMEGKMQELARYAQEAISNIAYRLYIPMGNVQASDSGIRIAVNDNMKTAFQWQVEDLKKSLSKAGFDALDEMLLFLEENKDDFESWVGSDSYTEQKKYFITSAIQFSEYYNINNSRLTFLNIRYIMRRVEDFSVKKILGDIYFNKLKTDLKSGDLTTDNKTIVNNFIAPAVALLTLAKGLIERSLELTEYGVTYNEVGGINQEKKAHPLSDELNKVVAQLEADGFQYLSDMSQELATNSDKYEGYTLSAEEPKGVRFTNNPIYGVFGV